MEISGAVDRGLMQPETLNGADRRQTMDVPSLEMAQGTNVPAGPGGEGATPVDKTPSRKAPRPHLLKS